MPVMNMVMRLKLSNRPGTLAKVLTLIGREGGSLGAIDQISASHTHIVRDLMIRLRDREHLEHLVKAMENIPEVQLMRIADRVFMHHLGGKIEITPKRPLLNWQDLSLVYTPGVGGISEAIARDPLMTYKLTMKGNSVAIVTDGSAVLGLGDLGPYSALPVMEGKSVLFKKFAGIDAVPICLDVYEPAKIIEAVAACAPAFGGINLEDISAPKCFEIEETLAQILDIPVFHDDQHGTAIVTLAGMINALKVAGKNIAGAKIVVSGAGAAGVAITKILKDAGARSIIVCDRKGAIARDNFSGPPSKQWVAENTNKSCVHGKVNEVIAGADVFIGVSGPGLLNREDILKMSARPVVFALANPEPEVEPEEIFDVAGVVATGRSDYPNQINNALAFPGVFRGALDCHARTVNAEMCLAAAYALADIISGEHLTAEHIIPSVFNENVAPVVAKAVSEAAGRTGVAREFPNSSNDRYSS